MFADDQCTAPALPDFLIFNTPRAIFAFLLAGVPERALRGVTHLRIQFPGLVFQPLNDVHESYLTACRILLRILPNLQDLVFLWTGVPARVFDGVAFRLEALTCTMALDDFEGLKFLTMQDGLQLVELPYWQTTGSARPFFPREALLPDLAEVSLPPIGLMQLVPGRPVHSVDVRLVGRRTSQTLAHRSMSIKQMRLDESRRTSELDSELEGERGRYPDDDEIVTQLENHEWAPVMRALSESACIVDDLALATLDDFDPDVQLRAVATHLPLLRSLYIRVYTPEDTTLDVFQWANWGPYLAYLPHLESLKVEFDCRYLPNAQTIPPRPRRSHRPSKLGVEPTSERAREEASPRPMVRFSIPTTRCIDMWAYGCCPKLESVYIGVFGGDVLVDWVKAGQ